VRNGYVHAGGVYRGFGKGPDGRGWSVSPPLAPGTAIPLSLLFLTDKALAIAMEQRKLRPGDPEVLETLGRMDESEHALRLWLKRVPFVGKPRPPQAFVTR
jgi:hypothetical protein